MKKFIKFKANNVFITKKLILLCGLCIVMFALGACLMYLYEGYTSKPVWTAEVTSSSSMLPGIYPEGEAILEDFDGTLLCGQIYVYLGDDGQNVAHRFVYETKDGSLYFKGDNNLYFDAPIIEDRILHKVKGYRYE